MHNVPVISIIDDEESMRNSALKLVKSLGFTARAFPSAHAFLNSQQLVKTSCLILDINMPDTGGIELQDILSAAGYRIPIIFITAHHDEKVRSRALSKGAICFLEKPFEVDALSHCIDLALKASAGRNR